MTTWVDENAALVRRYLADVVAAADRSAADTLLSVDATVWSEVTQSWFCRVERGRIVEGWRRLVGLGRARQRSILPGRTIAWDGRQMEPDSDHHDAPRP